MKWVWVTQILKWISKELLREKQILEPARRFKWKVAPKYAERFCLTIGSSCSASYNNLVHSFDHLIHIPIRLELETPQLRNMSLLWYRGVFTHTIKFCGFCQFSRRSKASERERKKKGLPCSTQGKLLSLPGLTIREIPTWCCDPCFHCVYPTVRYGLPSLNLVGSRGVGCGELAYPQVAGK